MRSRHGLAALFLLAAPALLVAPLPARAKCASPGALLIPASGDLPPNPTLHLFFPTWMKTAPAITVTDGHGEPLPTRVAAAASSGAFRVQRVEIESGDARTIEVALETGAHKPARSYRIDPAFSPAPSSSARIEKVEESSYQWTCSHEEVRLLSVNVDAPLYRVEWADSEEAFRAGHRSSLLLPHRLVEIAFAWNDDPIPDSARLPLGYVDCTGPTMEWNGPIWAAVAAMYPDGTETPLGEPLRIEPPADSRGRARGR